MLRCAGYGRKDVAQMLLDAGSDVQVFCLAKPCCLGNMSTRGPSFWGLVRCMSAE